MEPTQTTIPSTPYRQFIQHLQRGQLDKLEWSAERQHVVAMPNPYTNMIVTANEQFTHFTMAQQQDHIVNTLGIEAMNLVSGYAAAHGIADSTFTAQDLKGALKLVRQMHTNEFIHQRDSNPDHMGRSFAFRD